MCGRWLSNLIYIVLAVVAFGQVSAIAASVTNYGTIQLGCNDGRYAIRQFQFDGQEKYLVVNPKTLATEIVASSSLKCQPQSVHAVALEMNPGPYFWALEKYTNGSRVIDADFGFDQFNSGCRKVVMSSDLCPSSPGKMFQRAFILRLADLPGASLTPVALSVSGKWMRDHKSDVDWLKAQKVSVSYVNHSDLHIYHTGVVYEKNFMTTESVPAFRDEVINAEITMLENGLRPSVFFRFPGLMSTRPEVEELRELGLIPLGTTAWLALDGEMSTTEYKNYGVIDDQKPALGRVILTHSNGNELQGIAKAISFLNELKDNSELTSPEQAVLCEYGSQWLAKK